MNSTERLLAVHRGELPDRVPVSTYELVGWNPESFENRHRSYRRLMDFVRDRTDCMYMTGVPVPNVRADERGVTVDEWSDGDQHFRREVTHTPRGDLTRVTSRSDSVHTTWTREHPVKSLVDMRAYLDLPFELGEPDFSRLERAWERLDGRRGLPLVSIGDPVCELAEAFEFGEFTVQAITHTEAIGGALDRLHERYREKLRRILTGPVQNAIFRICGPEYATPPYLPPELFRRFVTRYDAEYVRMIQTSGAFARVHSHGRIARVLDQIDEMGPDALDPLEPPPDGDIDIAGLKATVGDRLCLTGGIELKHLEADEPEFVEELVRDTMAAGKPHGRFILMPTAAPINVPLARRTETNYIRFIETALETGRY
ncbi:MAG: uroporphyrinogen decarboxylase family protein [Planctomycetota bacterium]